MLNPNNEKYLVKTIGYKLWYVIYGSSTTAIAKLTLLANIEPRVKFQFQLPSLLVLWSYRKKITYAMYYTISTEVYVDKKEDQAFISLHLQVDQFRKSFNTHTVFSDS